MSRLYDYDDEEFIQHMDIRECQECGKRFIIALKSKRVFCSNKCETKSIVRGHFKEKEEWDKKHNR
jgi:ribosomal protein S27AE